MSTPPNANKYAADIIESAANVASGRGEYDLAGRLWRFEKRLRDEGRPTFDPDEREWVYPGAS